MKFGNPSRPEKSLARDLQSSVCASESFARRFLRKARQVEDLEGLTDLTRPDTGELARTLSTQFCGKPLFLKIGPLNYMKANQHSDFRTAKNSGFFRSFFVGRLASFPEEI